MDESERQQQDSTTPTETTKVVQSLHLTFPEIGPYELRTLANDLCRSAAARRS